MCLKEKTQKLFINYFYMIPQKCDETETRNKNFAIKYVLNCRTIWYYKHSGKKSTR